MNPQSDHYILSQDLLFQKNCTKCHIQLAEWQTDRQTNKLTNRHRNRTSVNWRIGKWSGTKKDQLTHLMLASRHAGDRVHYQESLTCALQTQRLRRVQPSALCCQTRLWVHTCLYHLLYFMHGYNNYYIYYHNYYNTSTTTTTITTTPLLLLLLLLHSTPSSNSLQSSLVWSGFPEISGFPRNLTSKPIGLFNQDFSQIRQVLHNNSAFSFNLTDQFSTTILCHCVYVCVCPKWRPLSTICY